MRTLIVEDQTIMRDGLQALLASESDFEMIGATAEGEATIRAATTMHPDIILMGLSMPHMSGTSIITQIKRKHPEIKIVVLTFHKEDQFIQAAGDLREVVDHLKFSEPSTPAGFSR